MIQYEKYPELIKFIVEGNGILLNALLNQEFKQRGNAKYVQLFKSEFKKKKELSPLYIVWCVMRFSEVDQSLNHIFKKEINKISGNDLFDVVDYMIEQRLHQCFEIFCKEITSYNWYDHQEAINRSSSEIQNCFLDLLGNVDDYTFILETFKENFNFSEQYVKNIESHITILERRSKLLEITQDSL